MTDTSAGGLADRFAALRRLAVPERQRIPLLLQLTASDCGVACLAMALGYHGRVVPLEELRSLVSSKRGGVDAASILDAASRFGLLGRGVKVETVEDLELLDPGSVLHWRFNHFVVFDRTTRRGAWIVDPAVGRRFVRRGELHASLTGVALVFERGSNFEPGGRRQSGVGRYLRPLMSFRKVLTRALVTSFLLQALALLVPLLIALIVDHIVPRQQWNLLFIIGTGIVVLGVFHMLSALVRGFLLLHLGTRLDARLSLEFLEHLASLPFSFFKDRSVGDLMMRLNSNRTIREVLTTTALSAVLDGSTVLFYLLLLFIADLRLAGLVLVLGAFRILLLVVTWRRQGELTAESLQAQAESRGFQVQLLSGLESLKASGAEQRAVERWSHLLVRELNVALARGRIETVTRSLLESMGLISPLLVLLLGTVLVLRGELSLGAMLALNAVAQGFLTPLGLLVSTGLQLQMLRGYLDRIGDVMDTPREREGQGLRLPRLEGAVRVEDVTFRYSTISEPAVDGVSFAIAPGAFYAIVGASGSGKSTLASLLAGLYTPQSGRVVYDDEDLQRLDLQWVRSRLGYVAQSPYLFAATVRENLTLSYPGASRAQVELAARQAQIHEDIEALPMRYETPLAAGGASLSGGQRQRLALARALVHRPSVLVLDEATSALDARLEANVQQSLESLDCTRIVIAHRLSTVRHADQILVLDRGRLVQQGRHAELVNRPGPYRDLVCSQLERQGPDEAGKLQANEW